MVVSVISASVMAHTLIGAVVTDVCDGDTLTVEAALWPDLVWTGNVRVQGVDAPEIRGECEHEKRWALASRNYVRKLLIDKTIILSDLEHDVYGGRVPATVHLENGDLLSELLIAANYGRAYDGGTRGDWCDASLVLPSSVGLSTEGTADAEEELPADHSLVLYYNNDNGRISCAEARNHGIAPVYSTHPAYPCMTDAGGDGVVCE